MTDKPFRVVSVLYKGHIDDLGEPIGGVIYDILNPPWITPLYNVPMRIKALDLHELPLFKNAPKEVIDFLEEQFWGGVLYNRNKSKE